MIDLREVRSVTDDGSCQLILERLERAETLAAIRRGMNDADEGRMIPLAEAARKLRAKHGL